MSRKMIIAIVVTALYGVAGCAVLGIDSRDYVPVRETEPVPGMVVDVPENETITEARRTVKTVAETTNRWIEFRVEDIEKRERVVVAVESFVSASLPQAAKFAGPFAPLLTLLGGYAIKRRGDRSPEQTRKEKEASYERGRRDAEKAGKELADAISVSLRKASKHEHDG